MSNYLTRKEVLQHNTKNNCWIIIYNKVYNITKFIKQHPGGLDILLTRAGEDATSYFHLKHHKNKFVLKQLEPYYIGELVTTECIDLKALQEPFMDELIQFVNEKKLYTVSKNIQLQYNLLRVMSIITFLLCYYTVFFTGLFFSLKILVLIFQAMISASLFGFVAHENTHSNFPKNRINKKLLTIFWPLCWPFISKKALHYEHNSHHIKIGDEHYDFEVAGFAKLIRYSTEVTPNFLHQFQHRLAPLFYPFYANIITTFGGMLSVFWSSHNRKVALNHNISLLITIAYFILLPFLISNNSILQLLTYYLIYQCTLFSIIYIGSAVNHFIPQTLQAIPIANQNKHGYYVCHNTSNFCVNSNFWFWQTGGFNIQIEHHLLPFIPVENLKQLIPKVKTLCLKYNYPYYEYASVITLLKDHYNFLYQLSKNDESISDIDTTNKSSYQAR